MMGIVYLKSLKLIGLKEVVVLFRVLGVCF